MSAFGMNNRPRSTHTRRMRFSGPLTGVLCKPPFPEFVAKIRIQRQRSSADIYQSCEQNCNRPAAFKNATVRERPILFCHAFVSGASQTTTDQKSRRLYSSH